MKTVRVATDPPYEVRIGRGVLAEVGPAVARFSARAIVSDENVAPLWAQRLAGLADAPILAVPAGEPSKKFATLERVLDFMAASHLDRGSCLVALGGGVVGDLAGLAASLYMRGIAVVQVPTSLLAQVDASVGGKTAVNLDAGKNLAGTFHQPALAIADVDTLATLPDTEFRSGLGEVLKCALIEGEAALARLERAGPFLRRPGEQLEEVVSACVELKAGIVARDPQERTGERKILNLGHTFAHAIERAAGFGTLSHGEAVSVGIGLALRASRALGLLRDEGLPERVRELQIRFELPRSLLELRTAPPPGEILDAMRHDKKSVAGRIRLVLLEAAGRVVVDREIDEVLLARLLAEP